MLKRVYSKNKEEIVEIDGFDTLENCLDLIPIGAMLRFKQEKQKYKVINRTDNFIIIAKPCNLRDYLSMYTILDLKRMKCNRDNLVFGMYNYLDKEDCAEALKRLETALIPYEDRYEIDEQATKENGRSTWKPKYDGADDTLELSERGIADIEDVITEIYLDVKVRNVGKLY